MSDDYVAHFPSLFSVQSQRNAPGIYRNTLVNQKTGKTLFGSGVAVAVKGAG
jgi:hypothetical protein